MSKPQSFAASYAWLNSIPTDIRRQIEVVGPSPWSEYAATCVWTGDLATWFLVEANFPRLDS